MRRWAAARSGGLLPSAGLLAGHPLAATAAAAPLQLAAAAAAAAAGGATAAAAAAGQTYPPGFLLHVLAMLSSSNLHPELAVQVPGTGIFHLRRGSMWAYWRGCRGSFAWRPQIKDTGIFRALQKLTPKKMIFFQSGKVPFLVASLLILGMYRHRIWGFRGTGTEKGRSRANEVSLIT
jgi:hypothetical protein